MAYETSNPPAKIWGTMGGASGWYYTDGDDDGTVVGSDYFSDGDDLGMKKGDVVHSYDTSADLLTLFSVLSVTAGGAASLKVATVTT